MNVCVCVCIHIYDGVGSNLADYYEGVVYG